ncbi:MAG: hypothetical protein ABSE22_00820 [Xanthobacteraceae bacterium]|jgi:hypothetical protein
MKRNVNSKIFLILAAAGGLSGCGTYVPDIQEFWGTPEDATFKVNKIAGQVVCELRRAVQEVYSENEHNPVVLVPPPGQKAPPHRTLKWLDSWKVQVNLKLNIIEDTNLTPGVSLNTVYPSYVTAFPGKPSITTPQSYSTGFGATFTDTATRTDQLNMFFSVAELKTAPVGKDPHCIPNKPANADLFVQSDLKLYDWLHAAILPYDTYIVNYASNNTPQNTIIHDIKFEIVSDGSVDPTWKLVHISANTSPNLLSLGRDRSQELIITFAPGQGGGAKALSPAAQSSLNAIETGSAVQNNLRR